MTSGVTAFETPEEEHLREQERLLEELTEELATKEAEFATDGVEFARFRQQYLRRFAPLYAEVDRLEAEVARRLAEQEPTPLHTANAEKAQARAKESERLLDDSREEVRVAEDEETAGTARTPSPELRDLYRQAARAVHPDLASDDADRANRTVAMAAVNDAYQRGDAEAIRRILAGEQARPEAIVGNDVASRLVRTLRRIKQVRSHLAELDSRTAALKDDPMYRLFDEARASWLAGEDPLAADERGLQRRIASLRAQLAAFDMAGRSSA
jgi:hypothetical protein